jgi:hypothetical protein
VAIIRSVDPDINRIEYLDEFYKPVGRIKKPDQKPNFVFLPDSFHLFDTADLS